jgi:hypothetical protein
MSKHWNPNSPWLSPDAYAALSPAEKRALWRMRQTARRTQGRRQWKRRSQSTDGKSLLIVCILIGMAGIEVFGLPAPIDWMAHPASAPVTASFSYCKWGGGTNCVVDGDTFYLNGEKVRIAGIDAPETHDYRCQSELQLGERAARQLQALLNSGAVTMTSIDRDRDVYGRLLRNVSVNGQDVGEAMISAGVARAYAGGRRSWC